MARVHQPEARGAAASDAARGARLLSLIVAAAQLPWIAYAMVTGQAGFIPGCALSAIVQTHSLLVDAPYRGGAGAETLAAVGSTEEGGASDEHAAHRAD